jgi:hypothetical protein
MTYEKAIRNADALKAIEAGEVYLDTAPYPWHQATRCEPGGSHRLDIATSVWFYGSDPGTGLEFRWCFDIEPPRANGKGHYEIDADACRDVLRALPEQAADAFRRYLLDSAEKVAAKGLEYQHHADRQAADALALRRIAKG